MFLPAKKKSLILYRNSLAGMSEPPRDITSVLLTEILLGILVYLPYRTLLACRTVRYQRNLIVDSKHTDVAGVPLSLGMPLVERTDRWIGVAATRDRARCCWIYRIHLQGMHERGGTCSFSHNSTYISNAIHSIFRRRRRLTTASATVTVRSSFSKGLDPVAWSSYQHLV